MNAVPAHSIGAASRPTGCSVPTIRYYEQVGLLPPATRTEGNQRHYDVAALQRLAFVRRFRDFGFSIAQAHLKEVQKKLAELQALEASLSAFV